MSLLRKRSPTFTSLRGLLNADFTPPAASAAYMDFARARRETACETSTPIISGKIMRPAIVNSNTSKRDVSGAAAAVVKNAAIPSSEKPIISSVPSGAPASASSWAKMNPKTPPIVRLGVSTPPTAPIPKKIATENILSARTAETSPSEKFMETSPRIMCAPLPATSG